MEKINLVKKLAFTLAELLISLSIVGIIAELTIPMLISSVQKTTYETSAKVTFAKVNYVLVKMASDMGCVGDLKCTGLFTGDTNSSNLGSAIDDYFKVVKNCGNATTGSCFTTVAPNFDRTGTATNYGADGTAYKFITTDGINYYIFNNNNNCTNFSTNKSGHLTQRCGFILVDTNGSKLPNAMGRDVFKFWISNGKGPMLYPAGGIDDNNGGADSWWNATSGTRGCGNNTNAGDVCAGRLFENGWKMDY